MAVNLSDSKLVEQIIVAENSLAGNTLSGVIPSRIGYVIALTYISARGGAASVFNLTVGTKIVFSGFIATAAIQYGPFYPPVFIASPGESVSFSLAGGGANTVLTIYALYVPVEKIQKMLHV